MYDPDDLIDQLAALTAAMLAQTNAMRELAESNRQVVDLVIAQQQADDQDGEPDMRTFLDGSPRDD